MKNEWTSSQHAFQSEWILQEDSEITWSKKLLFQLLKNSFQNLCLPNKDQKPIRLLLHLEN